MDKVSSLMGLTVKRRGNLRQESGLGLEQGQESEVRIKGSAWGTSVRSQGLGSEWGQGQALCLAGIRDHSGLGQRRDTAQLEVRVGAQIGARAEPNLGQG